MKFKRRNCKKCGKPALPNRAVCFHCDCEARRAKRIEKATKEASCRKKRKERHLNSYKYLHKLAWDLQSKAMRTAAADEDGFVKCYCCGKKMRWQDAHIGHYFHGRLDFDPRNLRIQGACCNTYKHGNLAVYGAKLAEEGIDLKQLRRDAETVQYSCQQLKDIISKLS